MNAVAEKYGRMAPPSPEQNPNPRRGFLLFFLICVILGLVVYWKGVDFLVEDADGKVDISPERKIKREKRLKNIERSEQYVILADQDGFYPCYNCGTDSLIFLFKGEIWKYGVTIQGQKGRYRNTLDGLVLFYRTEFVGSLTDCLKQEAIKIFNYAKLPENLKRIQPIIRPPGNKVDL